MHFEEGFIPFIPLRSYHFHTFFSPPPSKPPDRNKPPSPRSLHKIPLDLFLDDRLWETRHRAQVASFRFVDDCSSTLYDGHGGQR